MTRLSLTMSSLLVVFLVACGGLGSGCTGALVAGDDKIDQPSGEPDGYIMGAEELGPLAVTGAPTPKVVIVEFSDFQCPYCSKGAKSADEVLLRHPDDVALIWVHMPLGFHKFAIPAAMAADAALAQGKFWEMQALLFKNQSNLTDDAIIGYAKTLGLDMEKFVDDMNKEKQSGRLEKRSSILNGIGVTGTPTFIINGTLVPGALPTDVLEEIVVDAKAKAEADGIEGLSPVEVLWKTVPEEAHPALVTLFGPKKS